MGTLDKISDFAFGIELLVVEKFIKDERQHKKLIHILGDAMGVIEEWRKEEYENGKKDGINEGIVKTATSMIEKNYPIEEIIEITHLNEETILDLQ